MKKLIAIFFILTHALIHPSEHEIYPFEKRPGLSWSNFEKNFRKKYNHLEIPKIVVSQNIGASYSPQSKTISINPFVKSSPEATEWTLLHEAGHHNDPNLHKNLNIAALSYLGFFGLGHHANTKAFRNLKQQALCPISNKLHKPTLIKGCSKIALLNLIAINLWEGLNPSKLIWSKPKEITADSFANTHASKEVLKAGIYEFSKEAFYQKNERFLKKECPNLPDKVININSKISRFLHEYEFNSLLNFFSHGTFFERRKNIEKALKERFGDDNNNPANSLTQADDNLLYFHESKFNILKNPYAITGVIASIAGLSYLLYKKYKEDYIDSDVSIANKEEDLLII